jgi:hypothetical protein
VRVLRIGFRPSTAAIRERNGLVTVDIPMAPLSTILAPMQISATRLGDAGGKRCPKSSDEAVTAALLDQARAGLLAVVVARESNPSDQNRLVFERLMDGRSSRIEQQKVRREVSSKTTNSFIAAKSADQFVREGFLQTVEGESVFMAPDADVLLNDEFANAYCFRIAKSDKNRPTQVGLQFRPSDALQQLDPVYSLSSGADGIGIRALTTRRIDVDGTLWIDTSANAIRDIEFRYMGLDRVMMELNPGGTLRFLSMKNGVTLVDNWTLRLVGVERGNENDRNRFISLGSLRNRLQLSESGGELVRADWPDSTSYVAPMGEAVIAVVDGKNAPVAGVEVRLVDTDYTGVTDASGKITVTDLVPGPYKVAFEDLRLQRIGLAIETKTRFEAERGVRREVVVTRRTAEDFVGEKCGGAAQVAKGRPVTFIAGRILKQGTVDIRETTVSAFVEFAPGAWKRVEENYKPGPDGYYYLCSPDFVQDAMVRVEIEGGSIERSSASGKLSGTLMVVDLPVTSKRR